jgi:hypothetical protein
MIGLTPGNLIIHLRKLEEASPPLSIALRSSPADADGLTLNVLICPSGD